MLSSHCTSLLAVSITCLIIGLVFGNPVFISISLIPFSLIMLGLLLTRNPRLSTFTREAKTRVTTGEILEIKYELEFRGGPGIVVMFQELPPHFELVEGNSIRAIWKGFKTKKHSFSLKIRCTRRGDYSLAQLKCQSTPALRLIRPHIETPGKPLEISVSPRLLNLSRVRDLRGIATSPFPVIDIARIGVPTTDFREIRDYVQGDSMNNINWKATARNTAPDQKPLTNVYEVEGKKSVWLFLNAASFLQVGTDIENAFEYCLEAANGVCYYYLIEGFRVGMYIFNSGTRLIYPDTGKLQYSRISRELTTLKPGLKSDGFCEAVEKSRRYLLGLNPLSIVITGIDDRHGEDITRGIRELHCLYGIRKHRMPVVVINVSPYNVIRDQQDYDRGALLMLKLKTRPTLNRLCHLGASVVDWNPRQCSFSASMIRQLRGK